MNSSPKLFGKIDEILLSRFPLHADSGFVDRRFDGIGFRGVPIVEPGSRLSALQRESTIPQMAAGRKSARLVNHQVHFYQDRKRVLLVGGNRPGSTCGSGDGTLRASGDPGPGCDHTGQVGGFAPCVTSGMEAPWVR